AGNLPVVPSSASVMEIITAITRSNLGLAIVQTAEGWAIITDGDVRRAVERYGKEVFDHRAADLMSRDPAQVPVGTRVEDALQLMERRRISSLLVFDGTELVGLFKK